MASHTSGDETRAQTEEVKGHTQGHTTAGTAAGHKTRPELPVTMPVNQHLRPGDVAPSLVSKQKPLWWLYAYPPVRVQSYLPDRFCLLGFG